MAGDPAADVQSGALDGSTLCILAHQDDEVPMAVRIAERTAKGLPVQCLFLTDGAARGGAGSRRNRESLRALERLGVPAAKVTFLGHGGRYQDGRLVERLEDCFRESLEVAGPGHVREVFCLAWEGGHPDHDAAHLIAIAIAKRLGCLPAFRAFPNYNGCGTRGPFFRVGRPVAGHKVLEIRRLAVGEGLRIARLCFGYPSQWRTWLGLGPEMIWRSLFLRRSAELGADVPAVLERPHPGPLFYERRFGISYERFREQTRDFLMRHVVSTGGPRTEPQLPGRHAT